MAGLRCSVLRLSPALGGGQAGVFFLAAAPRRDGPAVFHVTTDSAVEAADRHGRVGHAQRVGRALRCGQSAKGERVVVSGWWEEGGVQGFLDVVLDVVISFSVFFSSAPVQGHTYYAADGFRVQTVGIAGGWHAHEGVGLRCGIEIRVIHCAEKSISM